MPNEYSGTDDVVRELRLLRAETVASCEASTDRLAGLRARIDDPLDVTATLVDASAVDVRGTVDVRLAGGAGLTSTDPLHTAVTNPAEATDVAPVVNAVELSNEAVRSAVWFLAGLLLVGTVVGPLLVRTFQP